MATDTSLNAIFKAYDVRGVVPSELDERRAFAIGAGFARFVNEQTGATHVLIGATCVPRAWRLVARSSPARTQSGRP